MTTTKLLRDGVKWTGIAIWFDISDRLIGGPLDWLFAQSHWAVWLDGFTNITGSNSSEGAIDERTRSPLLDNPLASNAFAHETIAFLYTAQPARSLHRTPAHNSVKYDGSS